MERNNRLKILNIISGSHKGGAEKFFERFTVSINGYLNISQKIIIKKNQDRFVFFKKKGIDVTQLAFRSNFDFFTKEKVKYHIKSFRPDIVLTWMNRASNMLPEKKDYDYKTVGRLGGYYKIKNYLKCDYLIANTEDIRTYIIEEGWDPDKVFYIPNFVEKSSDKKLDKSKHNTPKEKNILLALGRFHENKGFDILIKSLKKLPEYYLWILGRGELKKYYVQLAKKNDVIERVKFIDWIDEPSKYFNTADILVCPSRIEPLGNIVIEAWAHKIPVIASDIMGPKKLIRNNENGLKFDVENIDELVLRVNTLRKSPALKKKIITNGYDDYLSKFSEKKIKDKFLKFFNDIRL